MTGKTLMEVLADPMYEVERKQRDDLEGNRWAVKFSCDDMHFELMNVSEATAVILEKVAQDANNYIQSHAIVAEYHQGDSANAEKSSDSSAPCNVGTG